MPVLSCWTSKWPVVDGNHCMAAALLREDSHILESIAGQIDGAAELLGVDEDVLMEADS